MVSHGYYDDEPAFRRYNSRGHGYPLSHDRELPPAPLHMNYDNRRSQHPVQHDARVSDHPSDQESNSRPRSRIPVACGRCRKRKIRCSGDNGGPCSNCKSAGNEHCQFLRVSSTEAQMKSDNSAPITDFPYNAEAATSRMQCRMVPQGHQYALPQAHTPPGGYDAYQYPNNSLSAYQYPVKPYYSMPAFTEFAEENVEYGLRAAPHYMMSSEHLALTTNPNYGPSVPSRGWTPTPQLQKGASLFLDQDPTYNSSQLTYASGSLPLRPPTSPEPKGLALASVPSLPTPVTENDRVLPYPAANRPGQIGSFLRSHDTLNSNFQANYQHYNSLMTPNMLNNAKTINNNAVSDNPTYLPMSSTSPQSLTSSQLAYSGSERRAINGQHQHDTYNSNEGLYHSSEVSDASYGPSSGPHKRGSQCSHLGSSDESPLPSLSDGNLSNGHPYIPFNSQATYSSPSLREVGNLPRTAQHMSAVQ